jgi:hypothetical protein
MSFINKNKVKPKNITNNLHPSIKGSHNKELDNIQ